MSRMRFKSRIFASLYISTVIISVAFAIFFAATNKQQSLNEAGTAGVAISKQVLGACTFLIDNIESLSNTFFWESDIQALMANNKGVLEEKDISLHSTKAHASSKTSNNSYITAYAIFNDVGTLIDSISMDNSCVAESARSTEEIELLERVKELNGRMFWFEIDKNQHLFLSRNTSDKVACMRAIKDRNLKGVAGYVLLMINKNKIRDICISSQILPTDSMCIRGKGGITLYCSDNDQMCAFSDKIGQSVDDTSGWTLDEKNGYICATSAEPRKDLRIDYTFCIDEIQNRITLLQLSTSIAAFALLILFLPVSFGVSTYLMRPINQLLEGMQKVQEGNFKAKVILDERSEIDVLAKGFNDMVSNIDHLINENYILQIKEKDAEMKALQVCMNPHFIYNTLDIIYWQAENCNQPELAQTVLNLSRLLRLSLNYGHIFTSVKNEIELISRYLSLQKLRFGDSLAYRIESDCEADECLIPQYTLEPFVENAVVHGLYMKGGRLDIKVRRIGEALEVLIVDDGEGMSREKLDKLLDENTVRSNNTSYAVFNTIERMKLIYGNRYVFKIDSKEGQGTRVFLQIPLDSNAGRGNAT